MFRRLGSNFGGKHHWAGLLLVDDSELFTIFLAGKVGMIIFNYN
jgi:hypothetical protein